jgi:hypothetical protein
MLCQGCCQMCAWVLSTTQLRTPALHEEQVKLWMCIKQKHLLAAMAAMHKLAHERVNITYAACSSLHRCLHLQRRTPRRRQLATQRHSATHSPRLTQSMHRRASAAQQQIVLVLLQLPTQGSATHHPAIALVIPQCISASARNDNL